MGTMARRLTLKMYIDVNQQAAHGFRRRASKLVHGVFRSDSSTLAKLEPVRMTLLQAAEFDREANHAIMGIRMISWPGSTQVSPGVGI